MGKFRQWNIKSQLEFLVIISILVMITVELLYYLGVQKLLLKNTAVYSVTALKQISEDTENECSNIKSAANLIAYDEHTQEYLKEKNDAKRIELYSYVNKLMGIVNSTDRNILDIVIIDNKQRVTTSTYTQTVLSDHSFLYKSMYYEELNNIYHYLSLNFRKTVFSPFVQTVDKSSSAYSLIMPVYSTYKNTISNKKIATCIITMDINFFKDKLQRANLYEDTKLIILDNKKKIVVSNDDDNSMQGKTFFLQQLY